MEFPKVGDTVLIWETSKEHGKKLEVVYTCELKDHSFYKSMEICTKNKRGGLLVLSVSEEEDYEYFGASDDPGRMYFSLEVVKE